MAVQPGFVSDLVRNHKDRFSRNAAHVINLNNDVSKDLMQQIKQQGHWTFGSVLHEPRHEKTCLWETRPDTNQTYDLRPEISDSGRRGIVLSMQLIWAFVFTYAKAGFVMMQLTFFLKVFT